MITLVILSIILMVVNIYQYLKQKRLRVNIIYMADKLLNIIKNETSEKLLVFTDHKEIISLLKAINLLLNTNQAVIAKSVNTETTMKKMLANISHDIKTPLTIILGYTEILNHDNHLNIQEKTMMIKKIHEKTNDVISLINKFFDLAKLEAGDVQYVLNRVHVNEICKQNILEYYYNLIQKGFNVQVNIPNTPIYIIANVDALNRILANLITNVIKHSEGTEIGFNVFIENSDVYIEVYDNGKGIEEVYHQQIFERLFTLDDARSNAYTNSGLGLTISKRLVSELNGEIFLFSQPYKLTKFTLKFKSVL